MKKILVHSNGHILFTIEKKTRNIVSTCTVPSDACVFERSTTCNSHMKSSHCNVQLPNKALNNTQSMI